MKKQKTIRFVKYFHELTRDKFEQLRKKKPHMTYGELAKAYPQPEWCNYPDAVMGDMGCWSLVDFKVKDKKYCRGCECLIKTPSKNRAVNKGDKKCTG